MVKFGTSFELAFRRSLFSLLLLLAYLLGGALLLATIAQMEHQGARRDARVAHKNAQRERRVDFERRELLTTLRAESLAARTESEWSQLANAKLDAYERLIGASSTCSTDQKRAQPGWQSAFRSSLLLITTMGGGLFTEVPADRLGPLAKLLAVAFSLLGIPLALIHVGHCVKALLAFVEANFRQPGVGLLLVSAAIVLVAALAVDIAAVQDEKDEMETTFLDALFGVLLAAGTVSGRPLADALHSPLVLFPLTIALLTVSSALLGALQQRIERWMAPHEFAFANGICGKIERAVSGVRLDEMERKDSGDHRTVRFGFALDDGEAEAADEESAHLVVMRQNIVAQTIREEECNGGEEQEDEEP